MERMWHIHGTRRFLLLELRDQEEVWEHLRLERWVLGRSFIVFSAKLRTLIFILRAGKSLKRNDMTIEILVIV